jgi:hypothetical protein
MCYIRMRIRTVDRGNGSAAHFVNQSRLGPCQCHTFPTNVRETSGAKKGNAYISVRTYISYIYEIEKNTEGKIQKIYLNIRSLRNRPIWYVRNHRTKRPLGVRFFSYDVYTYLLSVHLMDYPRDSILLLNFPLTSEEPLRFSCVVLSLFVCVRARAFSLVVCVTATKSGSTRHKYFSSCSVCVVCCVCVCVLLLLFEIKLFHHHSI